MNTPQQSVCSSAADLVTAHDRLWLAYARTGSVEDYMAFNTWVAGLSTEDLRVLAIELGKIRLDRETGARPASRVEG